MIDQAWVVTANRNSYLWPSDFLSKEIIPQSESREGRASDIA